MGFLKSESSYQLYEKGFPKIGCKCSTKTESSVRKRIMSVPHHSHLAILLFLRNLFNLILKQCEYLKYVKPSAV